MNTVEDYLIGSWKRNYIKRRAPDTGGGLGPKDSRVEVFYVQTPLAFVDIRRPIIDNDNNEGPPRSSLSSTEGVLAFGGVTRVENHLVHWHSCIDIDWGGDEKRMKTAWEAVSEGNPLETEDIGVFEHVGGNVWRETDHPSITLEEEWVKTGDAAGDAGSAQFLALRRGNNGLLVAVGIYWAVADADAEMPLFAGGIIDEGIWKIQICASDRSREGKALVLNGCSADWAVYANLDSGTYEIPKFRR